jgi:ribosomal protein S18 acetylase RimI-like enzyme
MPDELERAFDFMARGDMGGERTEPTRFGTAVFDDRVARRYDSNYLLVDELPPQVSAEELAAEAERYRRPVVFFRHEASGERVAPGFGALGWRLDRHEVMAWRRPPQREAPLELVREVDLDALREPRRRLMAGYPWSTPEILGELHEAKRLMAERVETRFYGVVDGGEVVAYADLYLDPPDAQIEDVGTLEEHRGRGYASALVLHAAERARRAGADLVFLVADSEDWPQQLYRRLGFDSIGRYVKLIRPSA